MHCSTFENLAVINYTSSQFTLHYNIKDVRLYIQS